MRHKVCDVNPKAEGFLPDTKPDDSGVGINYADAYLRPFKVTLEDGRKVTCKRRGLKVTLKVGDATGEGLLRRLEHGPDARKVLRHALEEAAGAVGGAFVEENGALYLELD